MKRPFTNIKNRLIRLFDILRMHGKKHLLEEMSEHEQKLADEFREKIAKLDIPDSQNMAPAHRAWNENMRTLKRTVEHNDPRQFLAWSVVGGTMFVKYAKYSRTEYAFLRTQVDWPRWKAALLEDNVGTPPRCPFDQLTSCNLVHHAYHLAVFENHLGGRIGNFDYVLEFGGGYGSMARLFFRLGFKGRYLILDLPAFSALQEYFLQSAGVPTLTREQFVNGESGVLCISDPDEIGELLGGQQRLFLATWSISEAPLFVREQVLGKFSSAFDAYLIAFQPRFEDVDNGVFFEKWCASHSDYTWAIQDIAHLPSQRYLFGKKIFH